MRSLPQGTALAIALDVMKRMSTATVTAIAILLATTHAAAAQGRFQAVDATPVAGVSGMRVVTVRDTLRDRCYLAFIAAADAERTAAEEPSDIAAAAAQRDRDLAALVHTYENDTSVYAGTITPNPLKYEVLAGTTQINFALTAIESLLARLEQALDRATSASRAALAVFPDPCAPADGRGAK